MSDLAGQWVGAAYGTNTGNVFIDIEDANGSLTGTIRINEAGTGVIIYTFTGVSNDTVELQLTPSKAPDGVALGTGTATALVQPDGSLTGRWETDLGTAGTFQVYRHNALRRTESQQRSPPAVPEQAFFHTASIGAVRLYKPDLRKLLEAIARDFVQGKPTVTYTDRGTQVTKFADAFLQEDPAHPLKSLKISIQEPERSGVTKLVNVDLLEGVGSQVRTSGSNESWVIGRAQALRSVIEVHQNKLVSLYRRYGLTINVLIFLLLLVAVPEITDWRERAGFVAAVYALLISLTWAYNRLVPNTLVFASDRKPGWWSRGWPSIVSWLVAVTGSFVATWIFWFFTRR